MCSVTISHSLSTFLLQVEDLRNKMSELVGEKLAIKQKLSHCEEELKRKVWFSYDFHSWLLISMSEIASYEVAFFYLLDSRAFNL